MPKTTRIHVSDLDAAEHDIYIGRAFHRRGYNLPQSPWANPFPIGYDEKRRPAVVRQFREWVTTSDDPRAVWMREHLQLLRGHRLACWCKPNQMCHGDVLIELVEEEENAEAQAKLDAGVCPLDGSPVVEMSAPDSDGEGRVFIYVWFECQQGHTFAADWRGIEHFPLWEGAENA